ncbi:sensor histidine kinase [Arcticibacter sp. MXS-1]|uniref:sensor histidine kinase n=1 Tax=Arcticibacter sp. MXS-1 TaxID=3341726 RepID=UPI0035A89728
MKRIKMQNWLHEAIPLLLWLGFVLFPFLLRAPTMPSYVRRTFLETIFLNNLLLLSIFYLHAFAIFPLTKKKKGFAWYSLAVAACLSIFLLISQLLSPAYPPRPSKKEMREFQWKEFNNEKPRDAPPTQLFEHRPPPEKRGLRILPFFMVILCSYSYCILRENAKREKALKEHENENLKTELSFLRSQISPHFMFNVLNSMVSLARKGSPLLEPSLINMSNLMRYMLYEGNAKQVGLDTELEYLKNYIDLQLLRYGDSVSLNLYLNGRAEGYHIEPMLLIPFVENAFKHGISMIDKPIIDISVSINPATHSLHFTCVNSISPDKDNTSESSGIGLHNVKRRLLLLYPEKHALRIRTEGRTFKVELKITLL